MLEEVVAGHGSGSCERWPCACAWRRNTRGACEVRARCVRDASELREMRILGCEAWGGQGVAKVVGQVAALPALCSQRAAVRRPGWGAASSCTRAAQAPAAARGCDDRRTAGHGAGGAGGVGGAGGAGGGVAARTHSNRGAQSEVFFGGSGGTPRVTHSKGASGSAGRGAPGCSCSGVCGGGRGGGGGSSSGSPSSELSGRLPLSNELCCTLRPGPGARRAAARSGAVGPGGCGSPSTVVTIEPTVFSVSGTLRGGPVGASVDPVS